MNSKLYTYLKTTIQKMLHFLGVDLIRYNIHTSDKVLLQSILRNFDITAVLDVGANIGQYAQGIISEGFKGKIYSFEPIPSVFSQLKRNSKKHPQWIVLNLGVGSKEDKMTMNISENFVSSSILKVNETSLRAAPETRITHNETIKITTIDSFILKENILNNNILLKLDVQGYELEALKGSLKSLRSIKLVQVELSFVAIYDGAPLFGEIVTFLEEVGFEIFTIIPGFRDPNTGRMLQADGIFINKSIM